MEEKLCSTNRQSAVRQLSGSSIHVYQVSFSFSYLAKKTGTLTIAEEDRARPARTKTKRKNPSFRADTAVTTD